MIIVLKDCSFNNITIAEGTNSGFYRQEINVIKRLKIDRMAEYFGVNLIDGNYDDHYEISLENNIKACVAKTFIDADLFINLPKIKMHYETEMSVCLKKLNRHS